MVRRVSLAEQVAAELRESVARDFGPGQQLPAEKDLAERVGVSRNTVREALGILWKEGLLVRRWGVGTFVRGEADPVAFTLDGWMPVRDMIRAAGHVPTVSHFEFEPVRPPDAVARILALEPEQKAWRVERTFAVDGLPAVFLVDHLPTEINGRAIDPAPLEDVNVDLLSLLRDQGHCRVVRIEGTLRAVGADALVAERLQVPPDRPLIHNGDQSYTTEGRVVDQGDTYSNTDVVTFQFARRVRV